MLNVEADGPVLRVSLNRPEVRNAFNEELILALTQTFRDIPFGTRAVVLRGEGAAFCAGGDLQWMAKAADYTHEQNVADAMGLANLFDAIQHCPAVTIAQVHGAAFGGGCGLTAAVDVAVARSDTKFAFSEVKLGLIPATISLPVIAKIGPGHARHLFATGEIFLAEHALRIGLIHAVAATDEELKAEVDAKLKAILMAGPRATFESKRLVFDYPLTAVETATRLADARASDEGREGIAAFLAKRKATFAE